MANPGFRVCFGANHAAVSYQGLQVEDPEAFSLYLNGTVRSRLNDDCQLQSFESDLRALASTEMASVALASVLNATTAQQPWQVGEALAECLLSDIHGVVWPWNGERDKLTPKASLPGADLVGFIRHEGCVYLVLGEVKTSAERRSPPQVLNGRSGMAHQLDQLASTIGIHRSLLYWLHARCKGTEYWSLYQEAVRHYLASGGRMLVLYGLLMRDTEPTDHDLSARALSLSTRVRLPTRLELQAWYLPLAVSQWPSLVVGATPQAGIGGRP